MRTILWLELLRPPLGPTGGVVGAGSCNLHNLLEFCHKMVTLPDLVAQVARAQARHFAAGSP